MIGNDKKCLYTTKSKIEIGQIDMFCQRLNATVPYPKNHEENKSYRDAFNSMNTSASVAVKSCHGIVELNPNGNWNPFPTNGPVTVACEKTVVTKARFKRQASSGNKG